MATVKKKAATKTAAKKRATTYDKPIEFDGTFDDMINISLTGAGAKKKFTDLQKKALIVKLHNQNKSEQSE